MKHTLKVTLLLTLIFFFSQLVGLAIISNYIDIEGSAAQGSTVMNKEADAISGFETPELGKEAETNAWIMVMAAVLVGTVLVLAIIKFRLHKTWKFWFMMSIAICLFRALVLLVHWLVTKVGIPGAYELIEFTALEFTLTVSGLLTFILVGVLTYFKIVKKDFIVHNVTEIFIYGGLASFIVPVVNEFSAIILLIGISLYDMIAVWKTKHMVVMAQFQTDNKLFAGLMMPYDRKSGKIGMPKTIQKKELKHKVMVKSDSKKTEKEHIKKETKKSSKTKKEHRFETDIKTAILGGGDIAFPLIFAGAIMKSYNSWIAAIIIAITTTIGLFLLLTYGKKDRFYPAMPFISAGCLIGYAIVLLV